jgi:hypothetical protein
VRRGIWGQNYQNGDLVLTQADGKLQMMVVIAHSGDHHHRFMAVDAFSMAGDGEPYCEVTARPEELYSGYWVGPKLAHLDEGQMVNLGGGIKIPPLTANLPIQELLLLSERQPRPIERRVAS